MSKVHDLINQERKKRGIHTVYWSREMARLAQSQANYCAKVGHLIHSNRFAFQGGENLAEGGGNFPPRAIVNCWLKSKVGHREYLLSSRVRKAGIGISKSKGKTYVAWAFSDEPPTYPDCPFYKPHRPKLQKLKGRGGRNLLALKLVLSLLVIAGFVDIIYRGHILFTHQISLVIGTIIFLAEIGFWIWLVTVLRRPKYRYSKPSFKLIFTSVLGIILVCAFTGIEPLSTYKDDVLNKITTSLNSNKSIPNNTQDVVVPTIPSVTSGDTTTIPTTTPITTPGITNPSPVIDIPKLEAEIHSLINTERQRNNLPSLGYDTELAEIARNHSYDMATQDYFNHYNPIGEGPTERAKAAGYNCYKNFGSYYTDGIAENIFQNWLYSSTTYYGGIATHDWNTQEKLASSTVNGWMGSSGHRQNILNPNYSKEGIGIAISNDDKVLITQDFW